ncbi:hypothetical protein WAI453_009804 [Rhynchosporium graminicola]
MRNSQAAKNTPVQSDTSVRSADGTSNRFSEADLGIMAAMARGKGISVTEFADTLKMHESFRAVPQIPQVPAGPNRTGQERQWGEVDTLDGGQLDINPQSNYSVDPQLNGTSVEPRNYNMTRDKLHPHGLHSIEWFAPPYPPFDFDQDQLFVTAQSNMYQNDDKHRMPQYHSSSTASKVFLGSNQQLSPANVPDADLEHTSGDGRNVDMLIAASLDSLSPDVVRNNYALESAQANQFAPPFSKQDSTTTQKSSTTTSSTSSDSWIITTRPSEKES